MKVKCVGKFVVIVALLGISSCCSINNEKELVGLSEQERKYITNFRDEQLIQAANVDLQLSEVHITTTEDIIEISGKNVKPVVYSTLFFTAGIEAEERRRLFIAQMLPHILIVKHRLHQEREVLEWVLDNEELRRQHSARRQLFVKKMFAKHEVNTTNELLFKLTLPPTSLILAQAAIATEWGQSSSFSEKNNPFKEPKRIEPGAIMPRFANGGDEVFLKEYSYPLEAITDYLNNINTLERYRDLREKLRKTSDPLTLVRSFKGRVHPSGTDYGEMLSRVIDENNLSRFDDHLIDPQYLQKPSMSEVTALIEKKLHNQKNVIQKRGDEYGRFGIVGLELQRITPESNEDIFSINGGYVVPYIYDDIVKLDELPVDEKKRTFFDMLLPAILVAAHEIEEARLKVQGLAAAMKSGEGLTKDERLYLKSLLQEWQADNTDELLDSKMIVLPSSIMLAQAALETGWGTSRFFTEAKNTFGIWSFNEDEPRVPAKESRDGKTVYVKKYDDLTESIIDYYKLIATGPYSEYRRAIITKDNPYEMIPYLTKYSELRGEYVKRLRLVMDQSKLERFDDYVIDPAYML